MFFFGEGGTVGHMKCKCDVSWECGSDTEGGMAFHDLKNSLNERVDGKALAFMKPVKRRPWKNERSCG